MKQERAVAARARSGKERYRRWIPPWTDIAFALLLLFGSSGVLVAVSASAPRAAGVAPAAGPQAWPLAAMAVLVFFQTVPLAFRRRRPVLVLAIVVVASVLLSFFGRTLIEAFALFIALYSVAAHADRRTAAKAGLVALAVLALPITLNGNVGLLEAVFELGFLALGWMFGAYLGELRGRAERVRHEQENEKRRAVAEEQARIARELHDVMAHSVSVMVVQAAAAGDVFDTSPGRARDALRSIESTGRHALAEVRRVLDVVRPVGADGLPLEPQPGLSQLGELIGQFRAAGLPVALRIEGAPSELPDGIDLSAYRIVQEALTNSLKHGTGVSHARVWVRYEPGALGVEICDDGTGAPSPGAAPETGIGRGLIGMRERVALYGGRLLAGPRPGGGFEVRARFPVGPEPG